MGEDASGVAADFLSFLLTPPFSCELGLALGCGFFAAGLAGFFADDCFCGGRGVAHGGSFAQCRCECLTGYSGANCEVRDGADVVDVANGAATAAPELRALSAFVAAAMALAMTR